ncbi:MAG: methionyl-tRNA formyltransferase [Candidatus Omnitrophica bacterium]|nr:methionyl-tRNA formyltransferase [Candidatus Omnitrophota bacterium]
MKFIYFGSSGFSFTIINGLYTKGFIPELIVSQPDKPQGRGLRIYPTKVSAFAHTHNLPLIKPSSLNDKAIMEAISRKNPDIFIVADYGKILNSKLLAIPKIMTLGVHPSLLPLYRGAAPINWALINGEAHTGVDIFKMNEKLDSGEVITERRLPILINDDSVSLEDRLAQESTIALIETLKKIESNDYHLIPQDETRATFAPKLKKDDGKINWGLSATQVYNLIRGTFPWPGAYATLSGTPIKILKAKIIEQQGLLAPSTITAIDKEGITIACANGAIKLTRVKPQGKKEMDAYAFVLGHKVHIGDKAT